MTLSPLTRDPPPPPLTHSPAPLGVDEGWQRWIAENALRRCTPDSMAQTMAAAGIDLQAARQAIAQVTAHPIYQAALRHQQLLHKRDSVMANMQALWETDPLFGQIERIPEPDLQTFLTRYVWGCRPVILTGVADDWAARTRWTPAFFREQFGHLWVEIQSDRESDAQFEENKLSHRKQVRLADFIDGLAFWGNDRYLTANNELLRRPEFAPLFADIGTLPRLCDRDKLSRESSLWLGPAGTNTPLHHDTAMLFHTQLVGRKHWRLISPMQLAQVYNHNGVFSAVDAEQPDMARHPDYAQARVLEATLDPGDTLFVPLGWWHQVRSLEVSVSLSYSNLAIRNEYAYQNPSIRDW